MFFSKSKTSSHSLDIELHIAKIFNFYEVSSSAFLLWIMLLMLYLKTSLHTQDHLDFLLCYLLGGLLRWLSDKERLPSK